MGAVMGHGMHLQCVCLEGFDFLGLHQYWAVSIRGITPALHVGKKGSSPLRSTSLRDKKTILLRIYSALPTVPPYSKNASSKFYKTSLLMKLKNAFCPNLRGIHIMVIIPACLVGDGGSIPPCRASI